MAPLSFKLTERINAIMIFFITNGLISWHWNEAERHFLLSLFQSQSIVMSPVLNTNKNVT